MKIDAYLQRIHASKQIKHTIETIHYLQEQHMYHIPFENIDVFQRIPIRLDVKEFYQKIVERKRGGFCYELNGLFHWFLQQLGFKNDLIAATVQRPDGSWALHGSHATQILYLEQPYLVDVGFGDAMRTPIPLTGEVREDVSGIYRAIRIDQNRYDLERKDDKKEWKVLFRFDVTPKVLTDFTSPSLFNQQSPRSHFTRKEMITIATAKGRITLVDDSLTITENKEKQKKKISPHEKRAIIKKYFHMKI